MRGRERAPLGGVGYAAMRSAAGETVAAVAVVNATGDIVGEDGELIAGPRGDDGEMLRSIDLLAEATGPPEWTEDADRQGTTLVCVVTDAGLDKPSTAKVARMASAGVARAIDPVFTPFDGDVVFCLSAGEPRADSFRTMQIGSLAARVVAEAIRDGVREAAADG
jgi:L-aminopeptidase/D-esterase-like protein